SWRPSFGSQMRGITQPGNDLGSDRQLHRSALESNSRERAGNAIDFEQDAARLDSCCPIFDRALALALANFGRLLRNRDIRENADPEAALTLDVTRDRAACRFDLARGDPLRFHRLEAIGTEVEIGAAFGIALDPALEGLAELVFFGLQHDLVPAVFFARRAHAGGLGLQHQTVLRHRIVAENLALEDPALDTDDA